MFFRSHSKTRTEKTNDSSEIHNESLDKNKEAFKLGSSVAKLITSSWNSQENPGKVYIFSRRVHHGGIGALLGLSSLFSKSQPIPSGILSGLGEGLAKDDYADRDSWFTFDKKPTDNGSIDSSIASQTSSLSPSTSSTTGNSSSRDHNTGNEMREETNKTSTIDKTKKSP
jgi:hypothetical protein